MWNRRLLRLQKLCLQKVPLIDKLVEENNSVIEGDKIYNETLNTISSNDYCVSRTPYAVLFTVFLVTSVKCVFYLFLLVFKKRR